METAIETIGLYPRDLLETAVDESADRQWWAVYTKSRQEKVFCRQLRGHGISHYLPLVEKVSYTRRRRLTSVVPLFSGYVFMHGTVHERLTSLATNRVSQILSVPDGVKLCYDLSQIFRLIASGAPVTVEQRLAPGRPVRIRRGPLAGLEGIVLERRTGTRLFVAVDFLQQGASIDVDDHQLEPL